MEKHILITATSTKSWKDAIVKSIQEAAKTIEYLSSIRILNQTAKINGDKIIEYYAEVEITFMIDSDRK